MRPIDADRLLDEKRKTKYYHLPNGDTAIPIIDIEHAPTIEPKQGEWIDENNNIVPFDKDGCPRGWCKCSKCGDYLSASDEYAVRGFFCPNCGADMRKGADDETD